MFTYDAGIFQFNGIDLKTYTSEMLNKIVKSVTRCQYHQLSLETRVKVDLWLSLLIFLKKINM
jgi:hypothetical protein